MRSARWTIAPATLLAACVRQEPLAFPELGSARAMIVAVEESGAYALSALAIDPPGTMPRGIPLLVDQSRDPRLYALLYDRSLDELRVAAGPLALAGADCGRPLPAPDRLQLAVLGEGAQWQAIELGETTLGGVRLALSEGACPSFESALLADVRCELAHCRPVLTQNGCSVELRPVDCRFSMIAGAIGAKGEICFRENDSLGQCDEAPDKPGAIRSFSCVTREDARCDVDLYAPRVEPRFRIDTRATQTVTPTASQGFERPPRGYLADLAVLPNRIAVAQHPGFAGGWQECHSTREDQLIFLDPETMMIVETATAPPCLNHLVRDPHGDGVLGVYGGFEPRIGRFDSSGRLLQSTAFAVRDPGRTAPTAIAATGGTVAVTMTGYELGGEVSTQLLLADARTLQPIEVAGAVGEARELSAFDEDTYVAVDDTINGAHIIDAATGSSVDGASLLDSVRTHVSDVGMVIRHAPSIRTVFSLTGFGGGIWVFDRDQREPSGGGHLYERVADIWSIAAWPIDQRLIVAGIVDHQEPRDGSIAVFDPFQARFLPGIERVGRGPLGRLKSDGRRLWTILPWTSEVVRIAPVEDAR